MDKSLADIRKQGLQNRRDHLVEEYKAIANRQGQILDPVEQLRIERQLLSLEKQINEVDEALRSITYTAGTSNRDTITIPIAVIAMQKQEAAELDVVSSSTDLAKLKEALDAFQIKDIISCYGESRNDWVPLFTEQPLPITTILNELIARLNRTNAGLAGRPIIDIHYLSDEFLSTTASERRQAWDTLESEGGVLIIDAVSMYHPQICDHLLKSQLVSANNSIAMIVLSPLRPGAVTVNELLRTQVYVGPLERAFNYFGEHLNPFYEFGVADVCNLQRWLFTTLPKIRRSGLSPEMRAAIQAQAGFTPTGIGSIVTGGTAL